MGASALRGPGHALVPAALRHATELARTMRQADAEEVLAIGFESTDEALFRSLEVSWRAWTLLLEGQVGAMAGLVLTSDDSGVLWCLTSPAVERHKLTFHRTARFILSEVLGFVHRLSNHVDARHTRALAWLGRLGFEVHAARPYGAHGLSFCEVRIRR